MDQKLHIQKNKNRSSSIPPVWGFPLAAPSLWNPASFAPWWNNDLFDATRRNMDLMFGEFFDNLPMPKAQRQANVTEDANSVRIKMDVPGLEPEDLDISTGDGLLTISANKEEKQGNMESHYAFSYSTVLPDNVDVDNADVSLANNKLNIQIPKRNHEKQQGSQQASQQESQEREESPESGRQEASSHEGGRRKKHKH